MLETHNMIIFGSSGTALARPFGWRKFGPGPPQQHRDLVTVGGQEAGAHIAGHFSVGRLSSNPSSKAYVNASRGPSSRDLHVISRAEGQDGTVFQSPPVPRNAVGAPPAYNTAPVMVDASQGLVDTHNNGCAPPSEGFSTEFADLAQHWHDLYCDTDNFTDRADAVQHDLRAAVSAHAKGAQAMDSEPNASRALSTPPDTARSGGGTPGAANPSRVSTKASSATRSIQGLGERGSDAHRACASSGVRPLHAEGVKGTLKSHVVAQPGFGGEKMLANNIVGAPGATSTACATPERGGSPTRRPREGTSSAVPGPGGARQREPSPDTASLAPKPNKGKGSAKGSKVERWEVPVPQRVLRQMMETPGGSGVATEALQRPSPWWLRLGQTLLSFLALPKQATAWLSSFMQAMWFSLPFRVRRISWYLVGEPAPPAVHASPRNAQLRMYSRSTEAALQAANSRQGLRALMLDCGYDKAGRHADPLGDIPKWRLEALVRGPVGDPNLYRTALTCITAVQQNDNPQYGNGRLEYLGDGVLEHIVREHLYQTLPNANEGQMTSAAVQMVSNRALYNLAQQLHLDRYVAQDAAQMASPLYMTQWGGRGGVEVLCDAMEALIGAVELDQGYDAARRFVIRLLEAQVGVGDLVKDVNFKVVLERVLGKLKKPQVRYRTQQVWGKGAEGPTRHFVAEAWVGKEFMGRGKDIHKVTAEQRAAQAALAKLDIDTDSLIVGHKLEISDECGTFASEVEEDSNSACS
eukprot:jgi/Botrbrau1/17771/Bobra.0127s0026.1